MRILRCLSALVLIVPASVAAAQTFTADFGTPAQPPLLKDALGVYQTPLLTQATTENASPHLSEAGIRDIRYEFALGKPNARRLVAL